MGTRFEAVLWGGPDERLAAAAQDALGEIERLHAQLSAFDPASDIWDINARAAREPVRIEPRLFELLERCLRLTALTHGAFDITIGPLMRVWGLRDSIGSGAEPSGPPVQLDLSDWSAMPVGSHLVVLDRDACTVRFAAEGAGIDLGGVAKGYALDAAADILRECAIEGALLHGGTSSVIALGTAPDGAPWRIGIRNPSAAEDAAPAATVDLSDLALGVSAPHGRMAGHTGHVMNPLTGRPAGACRLAAVSGPSATDADALSTALLVLGQPFADELRSLGYGVWLMGPERS